MAAREFKMDRGEMLRIDARTGDRLQVWRGDVWVTQHGDTKDYMLRTGESMPLSGAGPTLAVAYKHTLLVWYRSEARPARRSAWEALGLLRKIFA